MRITYRTGRGRAAFLLDGREITGQVAERLARFEDKALATETLQVVLDEGAIAPVRAYPTDAGLDLISPTNCTLWPFGKMIIDTGVHVAIPEGYVGLITSKSSLMVNDGLLTSGTIDSGYTGSLHVVLFNHSNVCVDIKARQKIAQLVILPIITPKVKIVDKLPETDRGSGGFGSTGRFVTE